MSAALVINGTDPVYLQGSLSSDVAGSFVNGVSPANGNYREVQGHFHNATVAGNLLICTIVCSAYANIGGAYLPVPGAPTTPGFTWVFGGSQTSDTETVTDPAAEGGFGYITFCTAVYYILDAPSMASSVLTTLTTTFSGDWEYGFGVHDDDIHCPFELTEWSGVPASDAVTVVTAKGSSQSPDAGTITTSSAVDLLVVASNITGDDTDSSFNSVGSGFSGLDDLANENTHFNNPVIGWLIEQYQLNIASGSYATAFSAGSATDFLVWASVAVAFSVSGGGGGPSITLKFNNATETGNFYVN